MNRFLLVAFIIFEFNNFAIGSQTNVVEFSVFGGTPVRIQSPTLLPRPAKNKKWNELDFYKDKKYLDNPLLNRLRTAARQGALPIPSFESDKSTFEARSKFDKSLVAPTVDGSYNNCVTRLVETEARSGYEGSVEMAGILCAYGVPTSNTAMLVEPVPQMLVRGKGTQIVSLESRSATANRQAQHLMGQLDAYVKGQEIARIVPQNALANDVINKMCLPENGYKSPNCKNPSMCIYSNAPECLKCKNHRGEKGEPLVDISLHLPLYSDRANQINALSNSVPNEPTPGMGGFGMGGGSFPAARDAAEVVTEAGFRQRLNEISRNTPIRQSNGSTINIEYVPIFNDKKELKAICAKCPKGTTHNGRNDCLDSNGCSVFTQEFKNGKCSERCEKRTNNELLFGIITECSSCEDACRQSIQSLEFLMEQVEGTLPPQVTTLNRTNYSAGGFGGMFGNLNMRALGELPPHLLIMYERPVLERQLQIRNQIIARLENEIANRDRLFKRLGGPTQCESSPEIAKLQCALPVELKTMAQLLKPYQNDYCPANHMLGHSLGTPVCIPSACSRCINIPNLDEQTPPSLPPCSDIEVNEAFFNVASDLAMRNEAMLRICLEQKDGSVCRASTIPSIREIAIWLNARGNNCADFVLAPPKSQPKPAKEENPPAPKGAVSEPGG